MLVNPYIYSAPSAFIINEDFEGTGAPTNWFSSGSPDYDYSAVPLNGAQSLRIPAGSLSAYPNSVDLNLAEIYIKCKFKVSGIPASGFDRILRTVDETFNASCSIYVLSTGVIELAAGTPFGDTVSTVSAGTIYDLWVHFIPGTSGFGSVAFATTGSAEPTSGNNFFSGTGNTFSGAVTDQIILGDSANTHITNVDFDDVQIKTTVIG